MAHLASRSPVRLALVVLVSGGLATRAAAGGAPLAELPFLDDSTSRIVIDLAPEGHDRRLPLVLDTGATHTVLTPRRARELGVTVRPLKRDPYRRATVLGRDLHFHVDTQISDTSARRFEFGLLGGSFLRHTPFEIDFAARVVRFFDPSPPRPDEPDVRPGLVRLEMVSNRPGVELQLEGETSLALLDTGSPFSLIVSADFARGLGLVSAPLHSLRVESVQGPVDLELAIAKSVTLAGQRLESVPVFVAPRGVHNLGFPGDALLGVGLLSRFRVRLDYANQRALLTPDPAAPHRLLGADADLTARTGALIVPNEAGAVVVAVIPDGPAARNGVQPGDRYPAGRSEQQIAREILADLGGANAAAARQPVWLRVEEPPAETVQSGGLEWIRVAGRAGAGDRFDYDIAVVIDTSGSTAYASGVDVDGDGTTGKRRRKVDDWRSFNPRHLSSDPGDTVLAAERMATRILAASLARTGTRLAIVSFADRAQLEVPLGAERAASDAALERLDGAFGSGLTNLADAVRVAADALAADGDGSPARRRVMLILSDGYPTYPGSPERAAQAALEAAVEAHDRGIAIYTFALGLEEIAEDDVFARMAELSGGELLHVERPGEVIHDLPRLRLAELAEIEIQNRTTGRPGRALQVGPDGSFDGYVELAPGENRIRVLARGDRGGGARVDRVVRYEPSEAADEREAARFAEERERFQHDLRLRTLAAELTLEIRRARAERQRRELEVKPEPENGSEEERGRVSPP